MEVRIMTEVVQRLRTELAVLDPEDRADLAYFLLQSLDEEVDPNVEAAWDAELDQRIADIESGEVKGITCDEVLSELREMFP